MARPLRLEFEGVLYEVTGHGNAPAPIYDHDAESGPFTDLLWRRPSGGPGCAAPIA